MSVLFGLLLGIGLLLVGGYAVIHGSVQVARMLGLSEFFIGVVLIGFGTSSPELFASVSAAWHGSAGLAFGNVVGSNIANLLLILALTAVIAPIPVSESVATKDAPILFALTAGFVMVSFIFPLGRIVAMCYLAVIAAYIWSARSTDQSQSSDKSSVAASYTQRALWTNVGIAILGITLLVFGASKLIDVASEIARTVGVSETVIGLTIVAFGTSLPELFSSVMAASKRKIGLVFGNIIGSNVYNLYGILGVTGVVAPTAVPGDIRYFYNPVMLIVTGLVVYLMYKKREVSRKAGWWMIGGYVVYTGILYTFF